MTDQLATGAKAHDLDALAGIFDEYSDRIYAFTYARVRNAEAAQDITSQVFLRVVESIDGFDPERAAFSTWIFTITRNLITDSFRRVRPEPTDFAERDDLIDVTTAPDSPEDAVLAQQDAAELWQHIDSLSDDQAEVLTLLYGADLSAEEASLVMGRSAGAVYLLKHRALAALRKDYAKPAVALVALFGALPGIKAAVAAALKASVLEEAAGAGFTSGGAIWGETAAAGSGTGTSGSGAAGAGWLTALEAKHLVIAAAITALVAAGVITGVVVTRDTNTTAGSADSTPVTTLDAETVAEPVESPAATTTTAPPAEAEVASEDASSSATAATAPPATSAPATSAAPPAPVVPDPPAATTPPVDPAPQILASGLSEVPVGTAFEAGIGAFDTDGAPGATSLSVSGLPAGARWSYDSSSSGTLTWTPSSRQLGSHTVSISATDGLHTTTSTYTITVVS